MLVSLARDDTPPRRHPERSEESLNLFQKPFPETLFFISRIRERFFGL